MLAPFCRFAADFGRRTSLTRGNGTVTSYVYDAVSRLASLGHDLAGAAHDVTATFAHDPASGIASRTRSNDAYAFAGFANVNRTDTINGLNQVTQTGSTGVSHGDGRGNITAIGSTAYGYNVENWMTYGGAIDQLYPDPAGRLIRALGAADTRYAWDGPDLAIEQNASGIVLRRYVHGPGMDEPLVWYEGSGTSDRRWLHADERGSIVAVSDGTGSVIATNSYDEYGVPASGNVGSFGYTGQLWLPELGAYYYKTRIYNPALGRFMQTDPIGYGDGLNLYGYVKGDPLNQKDALGLCSVTNHYEDVWGLYDGEWKYLGRNYLGVEITGCEDRGSQGFQNGWGTQGSGLTSWKGTVVNATPQPAQQKKLPPCAQQFLKGRIASNPDDITFYDGGSIWNRFNNSVTYGNDIYLAEGVMGRSDPNALIHKFHEIHHTSQNAKLGINALHHGAAYVAFGGHDASPLEQAADKFADDAYKAYEAAGLDKTCPF